MPFPAQRPRRLRRTASLRRLIRETVLRPADLICPIFVSEDLERPAAIPTLPGQRHETLDSVVGAGSEAVAAGCGALLLFGIPARKDADGSAAWAGDGIVQRALRSLRGELGDGAVLIADCCLDEYTDHGHCGPLDGRGGVDNDRSLELYGRVAVSQADAGADLVAPSGMMDGQVGAIRQALDGAGFTDTGILAYSAKQASVLYGPFREAAACAPRSGDRRGYQMDPANWREALREIELDIAEGADMLMVKPALTTLDLVARIRATTRLPLLAYCVSGEYVMLRSAAEAGAFEERAAVLEALTAVRRAGADAVITYHARQAARWLQEEERPS